MVLIDDLYQNLEVPSFLWRSSTHQTLLTISALCRGFLYGFNRTDVHGLPRFLELLKSRSDYKARRKGLLTVSNHISVLDDPLIWGVLPLSFTAFHGYLNHRWTFGSHDLCYQNTLLAHFFTLGQVFPTHRLKHSPYGGIAQPVMSEGVKILSKISTSKTAYCPYNNLRIYPSSHTPSWPRDCIDPLSPIKPAPFYPSQRNDVRYYFPPSRYACNSYSWVHIFPEGFVHQSKDKTLRYFKWGVARLILEPPECPDIVPMFIEGTDQVMHESRQFPRFLPRIGKKIDVTFGRELDTEAVFGDLRKRWKELVENDAQFQQYFLPHESEFRVGFLSESLQNNPEAVELRIECTRRIREEVLKLRRARGYPDEDPKGGVAATWKLEGPKHEGKMEDDTWVKEA